MSETHSLRSALVTARVAAVLAAMSLILTLTGLTPADAARAVQRALSAKNSDAVDGLSASRSPKPGRLLALGSDAKFPATVVSGSIRGPRGVQGPQGSPGSTGPAGPAGPVEAITTKPRNAAVPAGDSVTVDAVQMILPAGNWFLLGTGHGIWDPGPGSVYFYCHLVVGASVVDSSLTRLGDNANASLASDFAVHGIVDVPATTSARLRCGHDQTAGGSLRVESARISAFRVTSVTTQNGDGT
jgi:hypothetical protein